MQKQVLGSVCSILQIVVLFIFGMNWFPLRLTEASLATRIRTKGPAAAIHQSKLCKVKINSWSASSFLRLKERAKTLQLEQHMSSWLNKVEESGGGPT
ncbi:hypothetical protein M9H77_36705 [Catharanthus roseus]|uniref:Uncharacterized protein n=1 Tax=Catharanthus roseus TaxID=4058 RepID=A0ACB9ZTG5_CATRO|nr:hypothetical protein M9H77_36705 [Catharanthus roseus]